MSADTLAAPADRLLEWYERHLGDPDDETEVYAGFALFFGGIALGVLGVLLFLWSATVGESPGFQYALREVAGASGAVGLPVLLLGVTVLLPVDRRTMYAALAGTVVCLLGVGWFVAAYPQAWNVDAARDASAQVVALYAAGVVAVVGATGAALVGHHLKRAGVEADGDAGDGRGGEGSVTDEEVRRDIEDAMADAELSWGGVRRTETRRLELDTGVDADVEAVDPSSATTTRDSGSGVDDAVSGLRKLQGREEETASADGTDEQTAALRELRERQRESERRARDRNPLARLRSWVNDRLP